MLKFVNLTPHIVNTINSFGKITNVILPAGIVVRCKMEREFVGYAGEVSVFETHSGACVGLPEPVADVIYIVSQMVSAACSHREDVVFPDELVRDENGAVIGCRSFARSRQTSNL